MRLTLCVFSSTQYLIIAPRTMIFTYHFGHIRNSPKYMCLRNLTAADNPFFGDNEIHRHILLRVMGDVTHDLQLKSQSACAFPGFFEQPVIKSPAVADSPAVSGKCRSRRNHQDQYHGKRLVVSFPALAPVFPMFRAQDQLSKSSRRDSARRRFFMSVTGTTTILPDASACLIMAWVSTSLLKET